MQAYVPQAATSSDAELQQGRDDVERDLHELTTNSLLKDVTPEIQGWAQAVRSAITEGITAARFALDPRQRDNAFGIRRQLGDYSRMARLVGALSPTLNLTYRKFLQSLDEVAAVILVRMGETLSNVGFNGGQFLLQAPYSELQVRRDTVIYALRNLMGSTQTAYGQADWPRGLDAYRKLFSNLELEGTGSRDSIEDLFDLLDEDYAETDTDEADQPQFDILYQLGQVLDRDGSRSSQEANIRDGLGLWPYGDSRAIRGPRVDLSCRTRSGVRMNLEVDLDPGGWERHRLAHEAAMQRAYNQCVIAGQVRDGQRRPTTNPLENVASIFVTARHPGAQDSSGMIRLGTITAVRRVQYRVGPGQRVSGVITGVLYPPSSWSLQRIAGDRIFTQLLPLPPQGSGTSAAFDAFWDAFADDAFAY